MNAGRNDPCPCGSGKKYKKCCLGKNTGTASPPILSSPPAKNPDRLGSKPKAPKSRPQPIPQFVSPPPSSPRPRTPEEERWEARWEEFEAQDAEGRVAVYLKTLDDPELMTKEMAFEMLVRLMQDARTQNQRSRFASFVQSLRERRPEVFDQSAATYLSWCLQDALAEGQLEAASALTRELAPLAGKDIDEFNRALDALAYHGQLSLIVEALRTAWPGVQSSTNIVPWGIGEFIEKGITYEVFDWLEHTSSPDPTDPVLLDRLKFFGDDELQMDVIHQRIQSFTQQNLREWSVNDFALKPIRKRSSDWDEEEDEDSEEDEGATNLAWLVCEFTGYLRHSEGVPFPRGELVSDNLYRYFIRRHEGDLDPKPSMLEQAMHPNRKLPKPPRPSHPLCPERVTFDVFLASLIGFFSALHYQMAAVFEVVPAWLRFLESRKLIDANQRAKTVAELRPLAAKLVSMWKTYTDDPTLYRRAQEWEADAAKGLPEPAKPPRATPWGATATPWVASDNAPPKAGRLRQLR